MRAAKDIEMYAATAIDHSDKPALYRELASQLAAVLEGERDPIANAANLSALVFEQVPDLNWAGFYFLRSPRELVLGPFQGKVACVRIAVGKGVCGTAVAEKRTMLVPDVHAFSGHIACDANSRSELVVPLISADRIVGVLDLDSPRPGRFDGDDQRGFERLADIYVQSSDLEAGF